MHLKLLNEIQNNEKGVSINAYFIFRNILRNKRGCLSKTAS